MAGTKLIIFDLGKVVFDVSFERVFQYWAQKSGQNIRDIADKFVFLGWNMKR